MTSAELKMRLQLLKAAIAHVPFDGWSSTSLSLAATDCNIAESDWMQYFPGGLDEVVALYGILADDEMVAAYNAMDEVPVPTHLKVRTLVMLRFHQTARHKETVRRSLGFLAQPRRATLASKMLYRTVDTIWRTVGDMSIDYNFYTKRATLAAIYSATMLAFLADDTEDLAKTEAFLDRRLTDISRIPKATKSAQAFMSSMASTIGRIAGMMRQRPFRR